MNKPVPTLEEQLFLKMQECENLKAKLALANNTLKFEEKEFEDKFLSRQANLMHEVKQLIGIDLENIEVIAEHVPEKDKIRIHKCISHIWKQIEKLSESAKE